MARQSGTHRPAGGNGGQQTCHSRLHKSGEAAPLVPGLCLCAACRETVEKTLIELPTLFDLSTGDLDLRPKGMRERVSGHRPRGIILREAVVSVRSEILGVLAAWCGLVTTERGVDGPDELSIRKLVGFLAIHLHWLCQHPAAPDMVDELTDLSTAVDAALRPETGFRVAVGTCLHEECGRPVHAEAHREGAQPYEVSCEAGHVWAPEHWLALRGKPSTNGTNGTNGTTPNGTNGSNGNGATHARSDGPTTHHDDSAPTNGNGSVNGTVNGTANGTGHANGNGASPRPEKAE
ncbi:hypothetical protein [Actinophytocola xinjiangensis]|nr:hypothetical protein [Actinophytocola xinjiangensis]